MEQQAQVGQHPDDPAIEIPLASIKDTTQLKDLSNQQPEKQILLQNEQIIEQLNPVNEEKSDFLPINKKKILISKRKAFHQKPGYNEIFVKNKMNLSVYIKRAHQLISQWKKKTPMNIIIHGLTASIPKCIKLALHLQKYYSDIELDVQTSSEPTIIDLKVDNGDQQDDNETTELKYRSGIHITVKKQLIF